MAKAAGGHPSSAPVLPLGRRRPVSQETDYLPRDESIHGWTGPQPPQGKDGLVAMAITIPSADLSPTTQAYQELQLAYDFFNAELFGGSLPSCLITLQRKGSCTYGYYCRKRFASASGATTDEIALNPRHIKSRAFIEVMSTLVHEMVHLWQAHFGKPSRGGYHNKQWAEKMFALGLRPSRTGTREGPMTGQRITHCIFPGGRFVLAYAKLVTKLSGLTWFDAHAAAELPKGLAATGLLDESQPQGLSGRRTVYRCHCGQRAESKSDFEAVCARCETRFEPIGLR
jgi:predicted SprT family Zn-dependent metalloprotease